MAYLTPDEWRKQKSLGSGSSSEPLDMGEGKRPYLSPDEWRKQRQQQPTMDKQVVEQVGKPSAAPSEPSMPATAMASMNIGPATMPTTVPQQPPEITESKPLPTPRAIQDIQNFDASQYRGEDSLMGMMVQGVDAAKELTAPLEKAGEAAEGLVHSMGPLSPFNLPGTIKQAYEHPEEFKKYAQTDMLHDVMAGGATVATMLMPELTPVRMAILGAGTIGTAGAVGEFTTKELKRHDVFETFEGEQKPLTIGDSFKQGVTKGAGDFVWDMVGSGLSAAAPIAFKGIVKKVRGGVRDGMEMIAKRMEAGDPNTANIKVYDIYDGAFMKLIRGFVNHNSALQESRMASNMVGRESVDSLLTDYQKVNLKDTPEVAHKFIKEATELSDDEMAKVVAESGGDYSKVLEHDSVKGKVESTELHKRIKGSLEAHNVQLADELNTAKSNLELHLSKAKDRGISNVDELLDGSDESKRAISKLKPNDKKAVNQAIAAKNRIGTLESSIESNVKLMKPDTAFADKMQGYFNSTVDSTLRNFNDIGRGDAFNVMLGNAEATGESIAGTAYSKLGTIMKAVEDQAGGGLISTGPFSKIVGKRMDLLQAISQENPEVMKLASLGDKELTFEQSRELRSQLISDMGKLSGKDKAFYNDLIGAIDESTKDAVREVGKTSSRYSESLKGIPEYDKPLDEILTEADDLYRYTKSNGKKFAKKAVYNSSTKTQSDTNKLFDTLIRKPDEMQDFVDYVHTMNKQSKEGVDEALLAEKRGYKGARPSGLMELQSNVKGAIMNKVLSPTLTEDGKVVIKYNAKALEANREAFRKLLGTEDYNHMLRVVENHQAYNLGLVDKNNPLTSGIVNSAISMTVFGSAMYGQDEASLGTFGEAGVSTLGTLMLKRKALNHIGGWIMSDGFNDLFKWSAKTDLKDPIMRNIVRSRFATSFYKFATTKMREQGVPTDEPKDTPSDPMEAFMNSKERTDTTTSISDDRMKEFMAQ